MKNFSIWIKAILSLCLIGTLTCSPVVRKVVSLTYHEVNAQKEKLFTGEKVTGYPRFFLVHESVEIIRNYPVTGIGTGSFVDFSEKKGWRASHPHNNILHMGTSYGFLGIAIILWLTFVMLKVSYGQRNYPIGYFVFSSGVVLFLAGMFDTTILNTDTLIFTALAFGLLNHLKKPDASTVKKIIVE